MAVTTEITRIQQAKSDIAAAAMYRNSADISANLISTYPSSLLKLDGYANYIPRTNGVVHYRTGDSFYDVLCDVPLYFTSESAFYIRIYRSGTVPSKTIQCQITNNFDSATKQPIFTSVGWNDWDENFYTQVAANSAIGFRSTSTTGMSGTNGYRTFQFSSSNSFKSPSSTTPNYTNAPVYAGGNIMSLMGWSRTITSGYCFWQLFLNAAPLKSAPLLPATISSNGNGCYRSMFEKCIGLEYPPILPSKTLAYECYMNMFKECRCLKRFPDLPAVTPADSAYQHMFYGCKRPNRIKCMTYEDDGTGLPSFRMSLCFAEWMIYTSPQGLMIHPRTDLYSQLNETPSGWELKSHEYNMSDYTN